MGWTAATIRVHAPAKLNLSLRVVGRRDDGYHLLDSIVTPISLFDRVTVAVRPDGRNEPTLRCAPAGAAPSDATNLAVRAATLFLRRCGEPAAIAISLVKHIPAGAGLGGGSSDASAVLRALNAARREPVADADLRAWALELGADVPFFLCGRPARMRGIGEELTPYPLQLHEPLVVCFPGVGLDTRAVYAKYDDSLTMAGAASSIRPLSPGQGPLRINMHNDLEVAAFQLQPSLRSLKRRLRALGAADALMTGSGSAMFGIWTEWRDAQRAAETLRRDGIWARVVRALERVPAVERVAG